MFAIPFSVWRSGPPAANHGGLAFASSLCAVAGFVIGAGVAAWVQTAGLPLADAVLTACRSPIRPQAVFVREARPR